MVEIFIKGGIVMIPLLGCSIFGLIIVIERLIFFGRVNNWTEQESKLWKRYVEQGRLEEVRTAAAHWRSPMGRLVDAALRQHHQDPCRTEAAIELAGEQEISRLQRGLGMLDTVVTASPLLGLLGTVTGIIRSFSALATAGGVQSAQLSMGIAEALYTTAFGLSIAIPALFFLNWFYGLADRQAQKLTASSREILSILKKD